MAMKFSILIPVYNVEKYISECLESVLAQTYTCFEAIIIDDGSTDNSGRICDDYAGRDARLKVYHRENQGLISARRAAIKKATGDFYMFLDSDDMLTEDALSTIKKAIDKYDCDCLFYGYEQFEGKKILSQVFDPEEKVLEDKKEIYRDCFLSTNRNPLCRKAVRASVFQDFDYSPYYHLQLREDLLQSLEIYKYSRKIAYISNILYRYRLNHASITHDRSDYLPDNTIRKKVLDFLVEEGVFSREDFLEYRDFCIGLLIIELIRIATLDQDIDRKMQKYTLIRDDTYYQDFLKLGITNRKTIGSKAIIYDLFNKKQDRMIIRFVSFSYKTGIINGKETNPKRTVPAKRPDETKTIYDPAVLEVIRAAMWGNKTDTAITDAVYEELERHTVSSLAGNVLSELNISPELKSRWKRSVLKTLAHTNHYKYIQSNLPLTVPYVILKGTAAAQYYPYPEYRTMGDIDIMTRREDYDTAYRQLTDDGYYLDNEIYKERVLRKKDTVVEIHRQFASFNDAEKAKTVDDLILHNINPSHVLPDMVNGLVLLGHINQHMEGGLGLRQIIDWMMFVNQCLPDEQWPAFHELVNRVGLDKLAITTTRMCEMYLGLPGRSWSADADEALCTQLMDYVMACGNFGNKKTTDSEISANAFAHGSTVRMFFRMLQKQGLSNWEAAQKHKILRPFAWTYQAKRYISKGLKREKAISKLKTEYDVARKRNAMFDSLGIKTAAKGIVVYKDGKYVKE